VKRLLAVVLTMVLAISGFSIPASAKSDRLGDFEHSKSKFSEYEYEHYDTTDLEGKINDIETLCVDSANIKTLETMIVEIEDELYLLNDLVNYSNYQFTRMNIGRARTSTARRYIRPWPPCILRSLRC